MMTARTRRHTLAPLLIVVVAASIALALVASEARAADGGTSSMPGMSAEEMQNMTTPAPAPSATALSGAGSQGAMPATTGDGHGSGAVMDPNMDMGGSANWFVVGGFVALIAGATMAAVATKRYLRRRMLAGELAAAGVQDV